VDSGEQFRLVASDYTALFKGLLEIKQEYKGNVKFDFLDDSTHTKLAHSLDADPTLNPSSNNPPRTSDTNANTTGCLPVSHKHITISPTPSSSGGITILDDMHETAKLNTTSIQFKRKPNELCQSNDEVIAKKSMPLDRTCKSLLIQLHIIKPLTLSPAHTFRYPCIKFRAKQHPVRLLQGHKGNCPTCSQTVDEFKPHQCFPPSCRPRVCKAYKIAMPILNCHAN
jgi:hypothetical protein